MSTTHSAHTLARNAECVGAVWITGGPPGILNCVSGAAREESTGQPEAFGALLRRLRRAAGLSQEELAARSGLSANAIGLLERGLRQRPYPHTIVALAAALGLSETERAELLAAVPAREPAQTPVAGRHRLPIPATRLVGRERELAELVALAGSSEARLITLTGVGGVGKTRLALEAAGRSAGLFRAGAALVRLAPLSETELLEGAVLHALGAVAAEAAPEAETPGEALVRHLRDRELLLVLDNFEHLLDAAPEVAGWLESCPDLTVLVTSRAPLRVRAEVEYRVSPLSLPASSRDLSEREVLDSDSGALFAERARASSPGFSLDEHNAAAVASICWRLAGLPLALELAAARTRFLAPAELLARLDESLSTAWARDLPERQRTMRATLDWSYDLLEPGHRRLLQSLSVFAGGFTLEAAEAVGPADGTSALAALEALVEHSLVLVSRPPASGGRGYQESRYRMLEPVRQYARERLDEEGRSAAALGRHAGFYLSLAEEASSRLWGPLQAEYLERLDRDGDNLRSALEWALGEREDELAGRMCWALWLFWWIRGHHREGRRLSEAALALEPPAALRARVLPVAAAMAYTENDYAVAEAYWIEGLSLSREAGESLVEGYCSAGKGLAEIVRADYARANQSIAAAIPLLERAGDEALVTLARVWLGTTLLMQNDPRAAERSIEEGLRSARRRRDALCTYVALYNLAQLAMSREEPEAAAEALREGIELSGYTKDRANLAHFLDALSAVCALREGRAERSAVLAGAAEGMLGEVGAPVYNFYRPDPLLKSRASEKARKELGEAAVEKLRDRGRALSFEEAVSYALGATRPGAS